MDRGNALARWRAPPEVRVVVMRNNRSGVSRAVRQVHARKNHSFFLVFLKRGEAKGIREPRA